MNYRNIVLKILVFSILLCTGIAIISFLIGNFDSLQGKVLLTTFTTFFFSCLAMPVSRFLDTKKNKVGFCAIAFLLIPFALDMLLIWRLESLESLNFIKILGVFNIWAISISILAFLENVKAEIGKSKIVSGITKILVIIFAIWLSVNISFQIDLDEFAMRLIGVNSVLVVAGIILTPILKKIEVKSNTDSLLVTNEESTNNIVRENEDAE